MIRDMICNGRPVKKKTPKNTKNIIMTGGENRGGVVRHRREPEAAGDL